MASELDHDQMFVPAKKAKKTRGRRRDDQDDVVGPGDAANQAVDEESVDVVTVNTLDESQAPQEVLADRLSQVSVHDANSSLTKSATKGKKRKKPGRKASVTLAPASSPPLIAQTEEPATDELETQPEQEPITLDEQRPKTPVDDKAGQPLSDKTNIATVEGSAAKAFEKTTEKGPTKHSPLKNAKVPYRVGLSRRSRIEPLLKIVRKDISKPAPVKKKKKGQAEVEQAASSVVE